MSVVMKKEINLTNARKYLVNLNTINMIMGKIVFDSLDMIRGLPSEDSINSMPHLK